MGELLELRRGSAANPPRRSGDRLQARLRRLEALVAEREEELDAMDDLLQTLDMDDRALLAMALKRRRLLREITRIAEERWGLARPS
jgi:hypothetical protein